MLVRPDGTDAYSPTVDIPGGDQTNPDWSPDGERLVFAVASGGHEDLWVVGADGTGARELVPCDGSCLSLDDPAWSPDGRTVLFSRNTEADGVARATLEVVDVATGVVSVIVTAPPSFFYAGQRWSPDGRSVVLELVHLASPSYNADVDGVTLAVIDLAAPTPEGRALTEPGLFPETAAWSHDGTEIVYGARETPEDEGLDLYVIHPDGTGLRRLTTLGVSGGFATHPGFGPDDTVILFSAQFPGTSRFVLAEIDRAGGEIRPATGGSEFIDGVHPRFRPVP